MEITQDQWNQVQKELSELRAQVKTYVKISRERANRDRDLRPCKQRYGYVFVSSECRSYWHNTREQKCWVTTYQTPYDIGWGAGSVERHIRYDFDDHPNMLNNMGIWGGYEDMTLRADGKTGYWNVVFKHLEPFGGVIDEFLPNKNKDSHK